MLEATRRRHERKHSGGVSVFLPHPEEPLPESRVTVADLTTCGMGLKTPVALDVGQRRRFELSLPTGERLRGTARVRWIQPEGYGYVHGLEFERLSWRDRRRLFQHLHPSGRDWVGYVDLVLGCAAASVGILVLQDLAAHPLWATFLASFLPKGLIVGASGLLLLCGLR